jgi:ATP-binding cassette subfamily B protein
MTRLATFRKALELLTPHRGQFILLFAVTSLGALLSGVGDPLTLKWLIDSLSKGDVHSFVVLALALLLFYTGVRLIRWWGAVLTQRIKNRVYNAAAGADFRNFFEVPYAKLGKDSGYYVSRICDEPQGLAKGVDLAVKLVTNAVVLIGALAVCLWLSWQLAAILMAIVPLLLYLANRYGSKISTTANLEKEAQAELREGIGRSVESYKTVNMFGLRDEVTRETDRRIGSYLSLLYTRVKYSAALQAVSGIFLSYAEMAVLIGAGIQVIQGSLTVGGLFGFTSAYWRVVAAFKTLADSVPDIATLGNQIQRMEEFGALAVPSRKGEFHDSIAVARAAFGYSGEPVLEDFAFSVQQGERVLVTGPNGSGKSTLTHILSGFLDVEEGDVRVPALERLSCLLLPFGFIPGTLKDNIAFDKLSPERRARFLELVKRFGLKDKLAQDPASLSEGEKRKFQVILTLMKDADFYIIDEPLSHVDTPSKPVVMDAILHHTRGKALVVVMHGDEEYRSSFQREVVLGGSVLRIPDVQIGPAVSAPLITNSE